MHALDLFSGKRVRKIGRVQVVIDTPNQTYVLNASGQGSEYANAKAVYNELKSDCETFRRKTVNP